VLKAKVFGVTTSTGKVFTCSVPAHPTAKDWIRVVETRLGPFMQAEYPNRTWKTLLLDGESLMHTEDAQAAMRKWGLRALSDWPPMSPDLNPEELAFSVTLRKCIRTC